MVEPYYEDDHCTIYHGDCREILPTLDFDCVITDPPYGTALYETDVDITVELLDLLARVDIPIAMFGYPEKLVEWCMGIGRVPCEWVTWWPSNAACRGINFSGLRRESECIAIFGENSLHDLRTTRTAGGSALVGSPYHGTNDRGAPSTSEDRRIGDVWRVAAPGLAFLSHLRQHPNEKPVQLMSMLVQGFDGVVADPFMGSGTTLRAAKDLGRKAVGIEIEERYCEIAAKRLGQEVLF